MFLAPRHVLTSNTGRVFASHQRPTRETIHRGKGRPSYLVRIAHPEVFIPAQVEMLNASSLSSHPPTLPFSALLFSKETQRNCLLPPCSSSLVAPSPWLTGDNYALLSSYCQAQFATQINWAAFEERGGQGEEENER